MIERLQKYVHERQAIHERRAAGLPPPWTDDPVLQSKKFCCVLRDDDRTSQEARRVILDLPQGDRLGAVLGFRLYNRVSTLEALRDAGWRDIPAVFAGLDPAINATAYKISVKGGLFNRETIAVMVSRCYRKAGDYAPRRRAQAAFSAIRGTYGHGAFLAYQTIQDLRWLFGHYEDEQEWCVLGLGALRGLARLQGQYVPMDWRQKQAKGNSEEELYARLTGINIRDQEKRDPRLHPRAREMMTPLIATLGLPNLFEVEHNLCEWDKYERIASGEAPGRRWNAKKP